MTATDVIELLGAANPLPHGVATALPLQAGESELLRGIVADRSGTTVRAVRVHRRVRRRFALGFVVAAAAGAALTVVPLAGGGGGPTPAFAAALVRFANSTPRLLLQIPGWHVVFVEQELGGGEMHFARGRVNAQGIPATSLTGEPALLDRYAQLTWGTNRIERRFIQRGHQNIPTGLGVPVRRLELVDRGHGWMDVIASLIFGSRELSLRVTVKNMSDLRSALLALTQVNATTWLEAMPPSVIKSANSGPAIRQMLKGIPLPPGFDAAKIPGVRSTQTNYYLGAELTGAVACTWIADWNQARTSHNTAAESRAIAAMATAPRWPVFHWMSHQGAWPQILISYANAMRRGNVREASPGIPLVAAVNSGLGCAQLGVHLGPGSNKLQPVPLGNAQIR